MGALGTTLQARVPKLALAPRVLLRLLTVAR